MRGRIQLSLDVGGPIRVRTTAIDRYPRIKTYSRNRYALSRVENAKRGAVKRWSIGPYPHERPSWNSVTTPPT